MRYGRSRCVILLLLLSPNRPPVCIKLPPLYVSMILREYAIIGWLKITLNSPLGVPKKVPILGINYQRRKIPHWLASVFYLADDVTRRGWHLRHHSFNGILAHWEVNRCCTMMLWASLCNSCVNIRILEAGDMRRLWRFRDHFSRLLVKVHIWQAHCDQTYPARTLKFSRKVV